MNYPMLLLCLLLLAFACTKQSIAAAEPVLDIDGEKLVAGTKYYILPVFRGRGGGITMASNKTSCPLAVVQDRLEVSKGLPLTFTPAADDKKGVILVSTDLNIKFLAKTTCPQSTVWKITKSSNSKVQWFVSTGGVEGNPGFNTVTNWFQIEKADDDYKLVFCPTKVCNCGVLCRDIGIYIEDNGTRTLSLSDALQPFKVQFKKALKKYS
ncbi:hypothetical protein H0E87_027674 [Populus deltoides]|jgi:hypothetical protein|uniref:Kunitz trypsin inhibitor n=1 Tax=Populus deltoides TaxID=3696 RepID=A0A8T2WQ49_POPDE|nr:hypothetical protein H0E87_027658 [Populus deltoides]KAH8483016.1 hypothetical protein H0E87_027674 [Populus deltoides]